MEKKNHEPDVQFGGSGIASVSGVAGGVAIATLVPLVILVYGQALGQGMITALVLTGIISGCFICFISAFFGLVMPKAVKNQENPSPESK